MKPEAIKDYYMVDGNLKDTKDLDIFYKITNPPIYEVIRVIDGVALFLEEHLERMRKSAELVGVEINRRDYEIEKDIEELIEKNQVKNLNVKLLCTDIEQMGQVFLAYFIKSFYPPEEYYKNGIRTILYHYERQNPNAKILKTSFKEDVARELEKNNAFEALLVNREGYITEGSRSNMFFVMNNKLYTAPTGEVLLGITRQYILKVCEELNIEVIEKNIHVDDLNKLDGAFMTGTSVNVLPIATIGDVRLESVRNQIINKVSDGYINKMKSYIKSKTL